MATSLPVLMDGMADQIRTALDAVTDIDIQVEPRLVGRPTPPVIDIYPADISRDTLTAGQGDISGGYLLTVRARVETNDADANQDVLLALLDDEDNLCLAHALFDNPTLGGLASDTDLQSVTGFLTYPDGLIGVQWTYLVIP